MPRAQTIAAQSLPGLAEVCSSYWRALEGLKRRPYDLLDYTVTMFERDYQGMCDVTAEMEAQLQAFIHESFEQIESTDQALDLLSKFQALMQRDNLRPYLNTKYLDIFSNFAQDLDMVGNMYERLKNDPPISRDAPPVAGRIGWVRHMLKMIEVPMHKFRWDLGRSPAVRARSFPSYISGQVFAAHQFCVGCPYRCVLSETSLLFCTVR